MKSKILALAAAMVCTGAFAQSKSNDDSTYMSLGYNSGQYTIDGLANLSNANHLLITLGKNISPLYAVEGVYATGMSDASSTALGTTVNVKLTSSYGLYIKPKTQVTPNIEVFGRVGFFNARSDFSVPAFPSNNVSNNATSPSWGLGTSMKITDKVFGTLDWMQMFKKDGADIKGFGLSVGYKF
jgi:hypothetical protein